MKPQEKIHDLVSIAPLIEQKRILLEPVIDELRVLEEKIKTHLPKNRDARLRERVKRKTDPEWRKKHCKWRCATSKRINDETLNAATRVQVRWEESEERFLIENYETMRFVDIALSLNRSYAAILARSHVLRKRGLLKG